MLLNLEWELECSLYQIENLYFGTIISNIFYANNFFTFSGNNTESGTLESALGSTACTNGRSYKNGRCALVVVNVFDDPDCTPEDRKDDLCWAIL